MSCPKIVSDTSAAEAFPGRGAQVREERRASLPRRGYRTLLSITPMFVWHDGVCTAARWCAREPHMRWCARDPHACCGGLDVKEQQARVWASGADGADPRGSRSAAARPLGKLQTLGQLRVRPNLLGPRRHSSPGLHHPRSSASSLSKEFGLPIHIDGLQSLVSAGDLGTHLGMFVFGST